MWVDRTYYLLHQRKQRRRIGCGAYEYGDAGRRKLLRGQINVGLRLFTETVVRNALRYAHDPNIGVFVRADGFPDHALIRKELPRKILVDDRFFGVFGGQEGFKITSLCYRNNYVSKVILLSDCF